jgi:putative ABC transport system substrate-binding protein
MQVATSSLGQKLVVVKASTESELETAFAVLAQEQAAGLVVNTDHFFTNRRAQIIALAVQHALPAIYTSREFAVAGGLMGYGPDLAAAYSQVGTYVGRILKGEKPSDLPVIQATKFEFVINLKTAKSLGLTIPDKMYALADDVIE